MVVYDGVILIIGGSHMLVNIGDHEMALKRTPGTMTIMVETGHGKV